jgi:hypothetical protein
VTEPELAAGLNRKSCADSLRVISLAANPAAANFE